VLIEQLKILINYSAHLYWFALHAIDNKELPLSFLVSIYK